MNYVDIASITSSRSQGFKDDFLESSSAEVQGEVKQVLSVSSKPHGGGTGTLIERTTPCLCVDLARNDALLFWLQVTVPGF